ncbi:MAG: retropepsin-like aspartic protease, partial [Nanoarchaeota archaeon]
MNEKTGIDIKDVQHPKTSVGFKVNNYNSISNPITKTPSVENKKTANARLNKVDEVNSDSQNQQQVNSEDEEGSGNETEYFDPEIFGMITLAEAMANGYTEVPEGTKEQLEQAQTWFAIGGVQPHQVKILVKIAGELRQYKALIDTGSTRFNFISLYIYKKYEKDLLHLTELVDHTVILADGKTRVKITKKVKLPILLKVEDIEYKYVMEFMVIDSSQDFIIGSPALSKELLTFFLHHWTVGSRATELNSIQEKPIRNHLGAEPKYYPPFPDLEMKEAPEEERLEPLTFNRALQSVTDTEHAERYK